MYKLGRYWPWKTLSSHLNILFFWLSFIPAFFTFLPPLLLFMLLFGRGRGEGVITRLHFIGKSGCKSPQDHENNCFQKMYMDAERWVSLDFSCLRYIFLHFSLAFVGCDLLPLCNNFCIALKLNDVRSCTRFAWVVTGIWGVSVFLRQDFSIHWKKLIPV